MPTILKPDSFNAVMLASTPLNVSLEQQSYIREILETACSDSRFAEKAYVAIWRVLTGQKTIPPVITTLNPATVTVGDPSFTLHVMGTGFTPTSVILWNGSEEPTTVVSATELTTGVDMSTVTVGSVATVAVLTDGVMSDVANFLIQDPQTVLATSTRAPIPTPQTAVKK